MFKRLRNDIARIKESDPAARSSLEIYLCYPGLHAVRSHRRANWLYRHNMKSLARIWSQMSRFFTGIEIHPGATIDEGLFIDHGSGVVIGETTVIGKNCVIYQGSTLGGTGKESGKRHPTLGNNVVVGAGAKVLGSFTVGDNVKIGAGSVVLKPVPDNCTVVGIPGKIVKKDDQSMKHDQELRANHQADLEHDKLPDPVEDALGVMERRIKELEEKLRQLEGNNNEQ